MARMEYGNVIGLWGIGGVTITARQAGNQFYLPATKSQVLTLLPGVNDPHKFAVQPTEVSGELLTHLPEPKPIILQQDEKAGVPVNVASKFAVDKLVEQRQTNGIQFSPNPVRETATIEYLSEYREKANLLVTDVSGRTIIQKEQMLVKGSNIFSLDVSQLRPGVYYLQIITPNNKKNLSFVKIE